MLSDKDPCDYEFKKKLARRISKIREKSLYVDIINIIQTLNPDIPITENENGLFIKFNTLTSQTYIKLNNYLHKKFPKRMFDDETSKMSDSKITELS